MIIPANIIKTDEDRAFYVYMHIDPTTKKPFYVGKGRGKRAYSTAKRSEKWRAVYKKLKSKKVLHEVRIVKHGLLAKEALLKETELIKKLSLKKVKLVNEKLSHRKKNRTVEFSNEPSFGEFLRLRRIRHGFTQAELGEASGLPQTTISKLECDSISTSLKIAAKALTPLNAKLSFEELEK